MPRQSDRDSGAPIECRPDVCPILSPAMEWNLRTPRRGPCVRDSLFSRGVWVHMLIAKESNTFLIACARRFHSCRARGRSAR
jgi:hypothetical protein